MSKMNDKGLYPQEEVICNDGQYAVIVKSSGSKAWMLNHYKGVGMGVFARMPYHCLLNGLHYRGVDNKTIREHLRIVEVEKIPATERFLPCLPHRLRGDGVPDLLGAGEFYHEGTTIPNYPAE